MSIESPNDSNLDMQTYVFTGGSRIMPSGTESADKRQVMDKLRRLRQEGKIGGGAVGDKLEEISQKFAELAERLDQIIEDSVEKIAALKKLLAAWEAFKEIIGRDEGIGGGIGGGDGGSGGVGETQPPNPNPEPQPPTPPIETTPPVEPQPTPPVDPDQPVVNPLGKK